MKVATRTLLAMLVAIVLAASQAQAAPKARSMQISLVQAYAGGGGCNDLFHAPPFSYPACTPRPISGFNTQFDAISFGPVGVFTLRFDATAKDIKISYSAKDILNFGAPFSGRLYLAAYLSLTGNTCTAPGYTTPCTLPTGPDPLLLALISCDSGICKGKTTVNQELRSRGLPDLIVPGKATNLEFRDISVRDFEGDVTFYQGILVR